LATLLNIKSLLNQGINMKLKNSIKTILIAMLFSSEVLFAYAGIPDINIGMMISINGASQAAFENTEVTSPEEESINRKESEKKQSESVGAAKKTN